MEKILVLAPHPDDDILGCGGTIAKHISNGDDVFIAVMTNGHVGAPELYSEKEVKAIRAETTIAHEKLKVKNTFWFDFPAPQLEQHPQYLIAGALSKLLNELNPNILYIPHKGDLHMDHGAIYNAALVAARPFPDQSVKRILAYETLSETEWGHPSPDSVFIPNVFNTLELEHFSAKIDALQCFESQIKAFPNTRSLKAIEHLASLRGSTVGQNYAEAFMLVRDLLN